VGVLFTLFAMTSNASGSPSVSHPVRTPNDQTPCDNWPDSTSVLLRVGARARQACAVFVGEVIGNPKREFAAQGLLEIPAQWNTIARLRVLESWKGTQIGEVVTVRTYSAAGEGVPFRRGRKYLVYAFKGDPDSTRFCTTRCERSRELRYAREDVAILGTLNLKQHLGGRCDVDFESEPKP
jgi:hypothetical protein